MKRQREISKRVRALRDSMGMNQIELAAALPVARSRVSEWETGKRSPSPEHLYRLGSLASNPDDAIWFWKKAGLDEQAILAAGKKILKDRTEDAVPLIQKGKIILVPRFRETAQGREETGPPLPLPVEFIPGPRSTVCLLVGAERGLTESPVDDIAVVDTSMTGEEGLESLWGEIVAIEFGSLGERQSDLPWVWPQGVFAGLLSMVAAERGPLGPTTLAQLWPLRLGHGIAWPITIGSWTYPFPERRERALAEESEMYRKVQDEIEEQARCNLRPRAGCRVIGRVIGWFRAAPKK